jgi:peptidoglycan/LPS O-acetylase OafA/YrhL
LGVVLYHAVDKTEKVLPNNFLQYPIRVVQFASSFGYIGVFLFFVISGFCIHLQWARAKSQGLEPDIRFGAFWKRRLRRLYPPYVITLVLFFLLGAATTGVVLSRFFFYDLGMHLLMLHNLDPNTCYTINGVFWTLAIEEQLYLAYFLLLFIRVRWGWGVTIAVCLLARVGWMFFGHVVWLKTGVGIPVPEAAASHWFTWALGALGVEVWCGLLRLRGWSRDLRLATVLIVGASALSAYLPNINKDTFLHQASWFLIHPFWGLGFFIVVNRMVLAENSWVRQVKVPSMISLLSTLGIFSYSIYLTHELVIMQSWRWTIASWLQVVNVFAVTIPATIMFAWVFFWFCEKPFMVKRAPKATVPTKWATEPSTVGD